MITLIKYRKVLRKSGGLFLFLLLFSCSSKPEKVADTHEDPPVAVQSPVTGFEKGKVVDAVRLRAHPTESYALYVPSGYIKEKKYPVIFFFDAHGDGRLPVDKYKSIAERFEVILAGSNNSRNGLSYENILPFAQHMMQQVENDLSVDERSIITSGFSGGARVAANIAMMDQSIKGVIGCSAGFIARNDSLPFVFAGITANEDMNYLEMERLELQLDRNKGEHILITGNGKHEWPDTSAMKDAMLFVLLRTLRKDAPPALYSDFIASHSFGLNEKKTGYYQGLYVWKFLNGVTDVARFEGAMNKWKNDPVIKAEHDALLASLDQEEKLQQAYSKAMMTQPVGWWKAEVLKLSQGKAGASDMLMNHRILNYLSLQAYMLSNRALQEDNRAAMEHFVTIYSLVDPSNPEWAYLFAIFYSKTGNKEKALEYLEKAADLGFTDIQRAEAEQAFHIIKGDSRFREAIAKMTR